MLLEGPTGTRGPCCQFVPNIVRDVTDCDRWHAFILMRLQADCKQRFGRRADPRRNDVIEWGPSETGGVFTLLGIVLGSPK